MQLNKDHWYDGAFYDRFIAPHQDTVFERVKEMVGNDSSVLDVGCGTGRLAFQLSNSCRQVDGVDLSRRNIDIAQKKLSLAGLTNVAFHHDDINHFLEETPRPYDFAVLTYVIHEIDEPVRARVLQALARSARQIILVDYLAPRPRSAASVLNEVVEFVAGSDHYRNFKSFLRAGGLIGLARASGLSIIRDDKTIPPALHAVILAGTVVSPSDACW